MSDWDCTDMSICMAIGQHLQEAASDNFKRSTTRVSGRCAKRQDPQGLEPKATRTAPKG